MAKTPEYKCWDAMKQRCYNTNCSVYKNYGGRGISVCERWINSFGNFLQDVGNRPGSEYSLDRIDNNGNYEPGNVRWTLMVTQSNNCRRNIVLTVEGDSKTIAEWSKVKGIPYSTIRRRLMAGCGHKECLSLDKLYGNYRSNTIFLTVNGVKKTIPEWAEQNKVSRSRIRERFLSGKSHEFCVSPIPAKGYENRVKT